MRRRRERVGVILSASRGLDEIFKIADRARVMRDARVVATQQIAETSPARLIELMTGRDLQQVYPPRETPIGDKPVLVVQGLTTQAVSDISFQLRSGEIIGIAGLSGSGRTELIRALMGADRVLAGPMIL